MLHAAIGQDLFLKNNKEATENDWNKQIKVLASPNKKSRLKIRYEIWNFVLLADQVGNKVWANRECLHMQNL